jgi:hypothetical protein
VPASDEAPQIDHSFRTRGGDMAVPQRALHPAMLGNLNIGTSTNFAQLGAGFRQKLTIEY